MSTLEAQVIAARPAAAHKANDGVSLRPAPTPEDRVFVGLIYRAMRAIAAAIKTRYGISILVEMVDPT